MNEKSDSKTDITFELKTVENLRRSIKGKMSLFTCMTLFTCTILSMLLFMILFSTLFTHTKRSRGIDRWCGIDWWGVMIPLEKILMHCWSVTWQHVSGPKITRTVHAYTQDYFQPNRVSVQAGWLFKPRGQTVSLFKLRGQTVSLFKPRTVDWWRGAILSIQTIFNLMAMIYSMYL